MLFFTIKSINDPCGAFFAIKSIKDPCCAVFYDKICKGSMLPFFFL